MEKIPIRHITSTPQEPHFADSFSIRDIKTLLGGKDMVQELHRHDFFLVIALKEGRGNHEIDFIPHTICDNSVFFMRPGQVHQLTLKAESSGYLMQFKADFYYAHDNIFTQLIRKASNRNYYQPDVTTFQKLISLLTYIFREYTDKQDGYQDVIEANLRIFLIKLIRHSSNNPSGNVNPYMQQRLEEFLELLHTHISTHKQVSEYAEMLNFSTYQLNGITKTMLGKTCSALIDENIILEAKRYLLATTNQVNQIAYQLGYEDISYFIRFFKKHTGYTPEAFRQNFK